jgi:hypothetical protein
MKKLLSSVALLTVLNANAQLANGSTAPDFTATDINGVSHNLYDYLNAGKTVIIDVSATWCGPCWSFHNTHTLRDMYYTYGPGGSNEVVILFVEGDNSTTAADLNGTGSSTQGDWVAGTPYPIIDNGGVANTLQIGYFPTVYRICPNKIVTNISPSESGGVQGTVASLKSLVEQGCATTLAGAQNHAFAEGSDIVLCGTSASPVAKIKNFGSNAITSANLALKENGTQVATTTFSGNIASLAEGEAVFSSVNINSSSTYTVEITSINSGAPFSTETTSAQLGIINSEQADGNLVTIEITTDRYGSETTWELKDDAGTVVASGGPYANMTANGTTVQPAVYKALWDNSCYTFTIFDSYGDGITGTYGNGSYKIVETNSNVVLSGGSFGSEETKAFRTGVALNVGLEELEVEGLQVYPNPASDLVNVVFKATDNNEDYVVTVTDVQGRVLITKNLSSVSGTQKIEMSVADLAEGNYIVKIKSDSSSSVRSIMVK